MGTQRVTGSWKGSAMPGALAGIPQHAEPSASPRPGTSVHRVRTAAGASVKVPAVYTPKLVVFT